MHKIKHILLILLLSLLGLVGLSHLVAVANVPTSTVSPIAQADLPAAPAGLLSITDTLAYGFTTFGEFYRFSLNAPGMAEWITSTGSAFEASDFADDDFSVLYALLPFGDFYQFDTASGAATFVTYTLPISSLQWMGMTWDDSSQQMYAAGYLSESFYFCSDTSESMLYQLDVSTGLVFSPTVVMDVPCLVALASGLDGLFYGLDDYWNQLVVFDAAGNIVTTVQVPFDVGAHHGLDFDDATGLLYATAVDLQSSSSQLWVIDPETLFPALAGFLGYGDGQQFGALAIAAEYEEPEVEGEINPQAGGALEYIDPLGSLTRIEAPPGAVTQTVSLSFTPLNAPGFPPPPGTQFVNHNFDLTAGIVTATIHHLYLPIMLRSGDQPGLNGMLNSAGSGGPTYEFVFLRPLTFTIYYTDTDLGSSLEDSLRLFYWNGYEWVDAIETCREVGILPDPQYSSNPDENYVQLPVCHLSRFGMVGN